MPLLLIVAVTLLLHQLLIEPFGSALTALLHGWLYHAILVGVLLWLFSGSCRPS